MNAIFRKSALPLILLASSVLFSGCATQGKPPPGISLDQPVQAQPLPEAPKPVEVVTVPEVLPMPAQMQPVPDAKSAVEPADATVRVARANAEARIAPTREGYVNAIQVWPFTDGALYQVYAAVGRVTVIALQPGEELVTVAAGDTVRWIVGDTSSGSGEALRVNVMVKPIRSGLKTNLVITTSRRTYLLELTSTEKTWMASVSWEYPKDKMLALQRQAQARTARLCGDIGRGARHERLGQAQPALGRRALQQIVQAVTQDHPADAAGPKHGLHAAPRRRCTRAPRRSTSSRSTSTSSWKASSSARGTTSRDSSVMNSAALWARSIAPWPPRRIR
ncbi:hypothetical protein G6F50_012693 [Rhizopus delemar]|uniref:P-type conjugative transfer protein TrbG n=1 Tax=Rhizopus delemar TaxID=936053 RepID=A0A9P6YRB7_9FUNG|nr:hypothetical protein G6F50_012693 [Rhizopus delemar]